MIRHLLRSSVALQVLIGLGSSVLAGEAPSSLPVLALAPPAPPETLSRWSGFYAGSEIFAISGSGALRGGVGGAVDFGYNHEFSNNVVVGVGAAVGYAPALLRNSPYAGFDLAMTSLKVGYDMGRLMPYVTTGIILEKPHTGLAAGYTGASDAVNGLFTGSSNLRAAGAVGVGFDYAVTDKLSVGMDVGVAAGRNPGPFGPGALGR